MIIFNNFSLWTVVVLFVFVWCVLFFTEVVLWNSAVKLFRRQPWISKIFSQKIRGFLNPQKYEKILQKNTLHCISSTYCIFYLLLKFCTCFFIVHFILYTMLYTIPCCFHCTLDICSVYNMLHVINTLQFKLIIKVIFLITS